MARTNGPVIPGEALEADARGRRSRVQGADDAFPARSGLSSHSSEDEFVDALDLDQEEESPFLRAQKRVSVRRGPLPKKAANRLKRALAGLAVMSVAGAAAAALYYYGAHSWRFRIESGDHIEISGTHTVSRSQVMEIMGGDIGRNIFFVPLAERKKQLEEIAWVESATVMRLLPDHLSVSLRERTPVAFARIGSKIALIDAAGVVMELSPGTRKKYSFPVIVGMGASEPLSTRAARMKIYCNLIRELDSTGARYSQDLSDVDLSDPENARITVAGPQGAVLVHVGASNFLERYKIYVSHVQEWRQQFQKLQSVDLRYDQQIILNPDSKTKTTPAGNVRNGKTGRKSSRRN